MRPIKRPARSALVLGAGGIQGYAHVGVLDVLDSFGFHFDQIVGCSIGAVVGAFYASGIRGRQLERLALAIRPRQWMDLNLNRMGLVAGRRLEAAIKLLTRGRRLEELDPPLAVVATDIERGEKVVLTEGPAAKAVLASASMPGMFAPVRIGDRLLVDGAILDRAPAGVARDLGADQVVCVSLGILPEGRRIPVKNALDVVVKCFDIMEREIFRGVSDLADVHIRPEVFDLPSGAGDQARAFVESGRRAAVEALPAISDLMSGRMVKGA